MAIYHLNAKVISRSAGRSATAAAAYRAGVKIKDERTGKVFDYRRKREVSYRRIYAPKNSPDWSTDREKLWNEAEIAEKRIDAQIAREVEVALPVELTEKQHIVLLERFIQTQFVKLGMVADVAIHNKKGNPHAHILLTTRSINGNGFGQKNRDWNSTEQLERWREQWAVHCNRRLLIAGRTARIDHRTLKEQGIDRIPTVHVGPTSKAMQERGIPSARTELNSTIKEKNMSDEIKNKPSTEWGLVDEPQHVNTVSLQPTKMMPLFLYPADWENASQYREHSWNRRYIAILQEIFFGQYSSIEMLETEIGTCYRINLPEGAVYDYGSQIKCETGSSREVALAVKLAKEKGWQGLHISGDDEFKEAVFMEAVLSGAFRPDQITGYTPTQVNLDHIRECMPAITTAQPKVLRRVLPSQEDGEQGGGAGQRHVPRLKF
jgi:hypothetical protein